MKIVLTMEEVKNIVCDFVHKSQGGEKPTEVRFVVRQGSESRETDQLVEVIYNEPK